MAAAAAEHRPFRYERKFLVEELDLREVELAVRLHPALFRETYPLRYVNNLYLDSFDARNYWENVEGLPDRTKVRIRWYGPLFGYVESPVLEFKIKRGLLGRKRVFSLSSYSLEPGFDSRALTRVLWSSDLPKGLRRDTSELRPSLVNRYRRQYFLSADGGVRLTIDDEREFYDVGQRNNTFRLKMRGPRASIVELKYSPDFAERAIEIAAHFPFRMTKSSKYVQGLELLAIH